MSVVSTVIFSHSTKKYKLRIKSLTRLLKTNNIAPNYPMTSKLCFEGCVNYNKKYSCPPFSPKFEVISRKYNSLVVNCLQIPSDCLKPEYNSIRISNVVLKSMQRKAFNFISDNFQEKEICILENGSCRLCKKCKLQDKEPCKYPEKMRPSLEATGVDVNSLVKTAFGFELQWYKKGLFPEYQCVVGAVLSNNPEIISTKLNEYFKSFK